MITLCMDTSHRYLTLVLLENDEILASYQQECFKRQSETALLEVDNLLKKVNIKKNEIDEICITKGPGSYTGIRIAMTIAKVICSMKNIPLYTLSTLRLFSCAKQDCTVLLDARGNRAYTATYKNGKLVDAESVIDLSQLNIGNDETLLMGDRSLLGYNNIDENYALSFFNCREYFEKIDNIHCLVPEYLKENDAYMIKK